MRKQNSLPLVAVALVSATATYAADLGTEFTYQGSLEKPARTPVGKKAPGGFEALTAEALPELRAEKDRQLQEKDCEIGELREQKDREIEELRARIEKLEQLLTGRTERGQ